MLSIQIWSHTKGCVTQIALLRDNGCEAIAVLSSKVIEGLCFLLSYALNVLKIDVLTTSSSMRFKAR